MKNFPMGTMVGHKFRAAYAAAMLLISVAIPTNRGAFAESPAREQIAAPAMQTQRDGLAGKWSGTWNSRSTGHRGPLRATITRTGTEHYTANFSGRFFGIIPFRYRTALQVVAQGDDYVELAGSKRLGPIMGSYSYHAVATGGQFQATFKTRRDQGVFQMRRISGR